MTPDFDIIIVGSGPAGVSAAYPLVESGLRVLIVDGGQQALAHAPQQPFLTARHEDATQADWMIGNDFYALRMPGSLSPKLRAPTQRHTFEGFHKANRIETQNFTAVGSLATGGLSNAWGCGVAQLSMSELSVFPCRTSDMINSYEIIAKRIGISGGQPDDLSDYFNLDKWSQTPIDMDRLHHHLYTKYQRTKTSLSKNGFYLGRSRVAALSKNHAGRSACSQSGNCLWGCSHQALYSAAHEIPSLLRYANFRHERGLIVEKLRQTKQHWVIEGINQLTGQTRSITCHKVLLAAGTLATTGLVMRTLKIKNTLPLLSSPTAAFLLWLPRLLGLAHTSTFGLGQLSFTQAIQNNVTAFGSTFSTSAIPITEFIRHLPLQRRQGIPVLKNLLSSCLVGNLFLPGHFSQTGITVKSNGTSIIKGEYNAKTGALLAMAQKKVRQSYRKMGAMLLPGTFTAGQPGSDVHYAGTFPMHLSPQFFETNMLGELNALRGIHLVDGACLPLLTEKPHTLTIMANADRIARNLVQIIHQTM